MATGACGIDCGVCRLRIQGVCSTCGPGTSEEATRKLAAQFRLLGQPCPVLECARGKKKDHCLRDCEEFPCRIFQSGPYPYSSSFLLMQERRRELKVGERKRTPVEVDEMHWRALLSLDPAEVSTRCRCLWDPPEGFYIEFLGEGYWVNPVSRTVRPQRLEGPVEPYLPLVLVMFLLRSKDLPLTGDPVTERQLPGGELFFRHLHRMPAEPLAEAFGKNPERFLEVCLSLGAEREDSSPASVRLWPLPRIPVSIHLWPKDEEFDARCTFTFDSSIGSQLPLDTIWALVHVIVQRILTRAETT